MKQPLNPYPTVQEYNARKVLDERRRKEATIRANYWALKLESCRP